MCDPYNLQPTRLPSRVDRPKRHPRVLCLSLLLNSAQRRASPAWPAPKARGAVLDDQTTRSQPEDRPRRSSKENTTSTSKMVKPQTFKSSIHHLAKKTCRVLVGKSAVRCRDSSAPTISHRFLPGLLKLRSQASALRMLIRFCLAMPGRGTNKSCSKSSYDCSNVRTKWSEEFLLVVFFSHAHVATCLCSSPTQAFAVEGSGELGERTLGPTTLGRQSGIKWVKHIKTPGSSKAT